MATEPLSGSASKGQVAEEKTNRKVSDNCRTVHIPNYRYNKYKNGMISIIQTKLPLSAVSVGRFYGAPTHYRLYSTTILLNM